MPVNTFSKLQGQVLDLIKFELITDFELKNLWRFILTNQTFIYKGLLLLGSSFLVVYLFPKGGTFNMNSKKVNLGSIPHFMHPLIFRF